MNLKDMISDNKKVTFTCLKDGELWYVTDDGFEFPVPLAETAGATFNASDRAVFFMRWIRKQLVMLEEAKKNQ